MERTQNAHEQAKQELKIILAAELFSKLSAEKQDEIINQTKALLSRG